MRNHMIAIASALALAGSALAAPKVIEANVAYVVDGDTAILEDGTTVHYLGISTPSKPIAGNIGEPFGQDAFELNKKLVAGKRVRLEVDAKPRDEKGAMLAYVHVGKYFVNATLLQSGYARAAVRSPNTRYAGLFERLQAEAKDAKRGLWNASRAPAPTFGNDALKEEGATPAGMVLTNTDLDRYDVPGEDEALEQWRKDEAAKKRSEAGEPEDAATEGEAAEGTEAGAEAAPAAKDAKEEKGETKAEEAPAVPPQKP